MKGKEFRGILKEKQNPKVSEYLSSLKEDVYLVRYEINLLIAHTLSLLKSEVIERKKARKILRALLRLRKDKRFINRIKNVSYMGSPEFYDIHPIIENYIIEKTGMEYGGYLNLGKSRNDAIATDMRAFMRNVVLTFGERVYELGISLLQQAKDFAFTPFISFTHQQPAQLTTFGYILYAYAYSIAYSIKNVREVYSSLNRSPLGACAVAGTSAPVDRVYVAELLGFEDVIENAVYAVSSRDFVIQSAFPFVVVMSSLSRLSTDFIFLSSMGYNYINVPDRLTDTSSAMPHKKNLSPLEILRARAEEVVSDFHSIISIVNRNVSGYNQDFQELKVLWWKLTKNVIASIEIVKLFIDGVMVNKENVEQDVNRFFITAIDLAEMLTIKYGIPFREAHLITGKVVAQLMDTGMSMRNLTTEFLRKKIKKYTKKNVEIEEKDLTSILNPVENLRLKSSFYAKERINTMYKECFNLFENFIKWIRHERIRLIKAEERLISEAEKVVRT